jgi:hypothetical protein
MKLAITCLISFLLFSCTKEKVPTSAIPNEYQSKGNFLILQVGTELDAVYEYQLATTELTQNNLPIYHLTMNDGFENYTAWKFMPNDLVLFDQKMTKVTYNATKIEPNVLGSSNEFIPFDSTKIQWIGNPSSADLSQIWSKVSALNLVKFYRNTHPNSKIGICRIVVYTYNPDFGFSVPSEKYLVFLVK